MAGKYTFSITNDFTNQKVDNARLSNEITDSAISQPLDYINTDGDICDVWFGDTLTSGDQTILNGVVNSHTGEPYDADINEEVDSLVLSSVNMSSTTSTRWQTKAYKISNPISSGTYKISWSYFWKTYASTSAYNPEINVRLMLVPLGSAISDDQAVSRQCQRSVYLDGQSIPSYGFAFRSLQANTYVIGLQYKRTGTTGTVYIADVFIEMTKISNDFLVPENLISGCNQLVVKQVIEPVVLAEATPIQL